MGRNFRLALIATALMIFMPALRAQNAVVLGTVVSVTDAPMTGVNVLLENTSTGFVRSVVTGQSLTFTVAVTNTGTSGIIPTGTVTFTDTTYAVVSGSLQTTTTTLASDVPLRALTALSRTCCRPPSGGSGSRVPPPPA